MSGLRTIVIGFGQIADGLRHDARMAEYFSYATHAQVLDAHPGFDWLGVVDPSDAALDAAQDWNVRHIGTDIASVAEAVEPEVAVITAPPGARTEIVHRLPSLKAVMVEKPLGSGDE
ncbi:MAG: Gfo/Idh/MocA family oxidoreductase, partial [Rhodospirillales bacterium]